MEVFLSWSGVKSKAVAEALKDWLPLVIQSLKPWVSASDIQKGTRWGAEIAARLEQSSVGIFCLTSSNTQAPWILFEAGAISKHSNTAHVCTYLIDLSFGDIDEPLSRFQHTKAEQEDTRKLMHTINSLMGENALDPQHLDRTFGKMWPDFEQVLNNLPPDSEQPKIKRPTDDLLQEMIELTRNQSRDIQALQQLIGDVASGPPPVFTPASREYVVTRWARDHGLIPQGSAEQFEPIPFEGMEGETPLAQQKDDEGQAGH